MPRRVVPILPAPEASSRSASRSRWIGRISGQVSAIISTSGVMTTPCADKLLDLGLLNLVSLIIGLVALICAASPSFPLLGWANWLIIPLA
jgi:hypothetical protein